MEGPACGAAWGKTFRVGRSTVIRAPPFGEFRPVTIPRVLFDDLLCDGQTQAGAPGLGRHVGLEHSIGDVVPEAGAGIVHREPRHVFAALAAGPGLHSDPWPVAVTTRLDRIRQEVVKNLPQTIRIRMHRIERRLEACFEPYRRRCGAVQLDDVEHQCVQIDGHRAHHRRSCVVRERVHHLLHRLDLLDDGAGQAIHLCRVDRPDLVKVLVAEALRCELDGSERVLDLVGEPARHLAPCGVALRLNELGDVIEHDHDSFAAGQRRGAAHEHCGVRAA